MTRKEKKKLLQQYGAIDNRINTLIQEVELSHRPSPAFKKELKELSAIRDQIIAAIEELSDVRERQVIYLAYIGKKQGERRVCLKQWQIANEMNYCSDTIKQIHSKALKNLRL